MYPIFISDEIGTLSFDEKRNTVLRNEVDDTNYLPVYVPNGDSIPDFFGYLSIATNKVYDIHQGISDIVDESKIKIS